MSRILVTSIAPASDLPRYTALAESHDITILSYVPAGWPEGIVEHSPRLREHRIPRGEAYARHYAALGESRIAIARSAPSDEALRRAFFRHSAQADVIVHTTAALFDIDERCGADGKPRVYDASGGIDAAALHSLESRLVRASARIIVASDEDRDAFHLWYDCPPEKLVSTLPADLRYEPLPPPPRRRHIILLNDYRIDVPGGGGHVRLRELYRSVVSEAVELTLLCFSDEADRRDTALAPHFRQITVPKTSEHLDLQLAVDAMYPASAADVVALVCCASNEALEQEFRMALATADAVVFEHIYMAPLAGLVPAGVSVIYSAQNVESALKRRILAGHPHAADLLEAVAAAEAELVQRADAIISVSREDAAEFRQAADKPVHVIENGVALNDAPGAAGRNGVLFIGSGHAPNVEALGFILSTVAPALPDVRFYIVGSVCGKVAADPVPSNVTLCGFVDEARKTAMLHTAAAAVNPMFSGSGSNLKLPEYFAAGLPVVSTAFGARGFDVRDGIHLRIAEADGFTDALREMLADAPARERMSEVAYDYARSHLSWSTLGGRLREILYDLAGQEERVLHIEDETDVVVNRELRFATGIRYCPDGWLTEPPGRDAASIVRFVRSREFADEDPALRSCTPPCAELERFVSLYGGFADRALVRCSPRSAARRAARLLEIAGVPVVIEPVFDAEAIEDHWLGWYDTLEAAMTVSATHPGHSAILETLHVGTQP